MPKRIDILGKRYGHLSVLELTEKVKGVRARQWVVACDACDGRAQFTGATLRAGMVTSCGCRPRLNLRGFNLVKRMKASEQRLCKSLPNSLAANPETRFFLEPSGKVVRRDAAEAAITAGELVSCGDGLFAETAQTWTAAP